MAFQYRKISEAYDKVVNGENFILPSIPWLKSKFSKFNSEMFGGKLPMAEFTIPTRDTKNIGETVVKANLSDWHLFSDEIRISDMFYVNERVLEDVLLHEMIHYENIALNREEIEIATAHEYDYHTIPCFKQELNRINSDYNRNIVITQPIFDKTKYIPTNTTTEKFMKEREDVSFYCVKKQDGYTDVYMLSDSSQKNIADTIKNNYKGFPLEIIKPLNNKFLGYEYTDSNGTHYSLSKEKFDEFKKSVTNVEESRISETEVEMPEIIKKAKQNGYDVEFEDGHWQFIIGD